MKCWAAGLATLLVACTTAPAVVPVATSAVEVAAACKREAVGSVLADRLAAFQATNPAPGFSAAAIVPGLGAEPVERAIGLADPDTVRALQPADRMLAGSVGKTFYAAAALKLTEQGRLSLDAPIARYLPGRIPNDEAVTVRMLLSHRSGYPPYDGDFMQALIAEPLRVRTFDDWAGPVRRADALGVPGAAFGYSDINYVLLAQVITGAAGEPAEAVIDRAFLQPLRLARTVAAGQPRIDGLVPGYEGARPLFGADRVLDNGALRFNPQFESGGGGYASTAGDMARWVHALQAGRALSPASWTLMSTPTGGKSASQQYGLGIHVDQTRAGLAYGHSGYIPGYLSFVRHYADSGITLALQTNASDEARLPDDPFHLVDAIAGTLAVACAAPAG
ncbi:serine hydrolase domain-containing protein [Luteimonas vadosa]